MKPQNSLRMKKIFTLLCVTLSSLAVMANGVEIGEINYVLDRSNFTASVTYRIWPKDESLNPIPNVGDLYTGDVVIPSYVSYLDTIYSVTSIGDNAFFGSKRMTSVTISNTVKKIGYMSFAWCSGLKELTFPESVNSIGMYIFTGDMSNVNVSCLALVPPSVTGNDLGAFLTVHVPAEVVSKYKKALGWNLMTIKPIMLDIEKTASNSVVVSWLPVKYVDIYEICVDVYLSNQYAYTDTLIVLADGANGGTMTSIITSAPARRITLDEIGSVVIITIDPNSGSAVGQPFLMTINTTRTDIIGCRVKVYASQEQSILKQDQIYFTLNDPSGLLNVRAFFGQGLYDLYGRHYLLNQWNQLPAGIYILREGEKASRVMKR